MTPAQLRSHAEHCLPLSADALELVARQLERYETALGKIAEGEARPDMLARAALSIVAPPSPCQRARDLSSHFSQSGTA